MANLSKYERETVITYNDGEENAVCYTCDKRLMRRLDEMRAKSSTVTLISEDEHTRTYTFPKKLIGVKKPREISEETKRKLSARAKVNFAAAHGREDNI
ncbi:MAG: hypothetical protein IJG50_00840 [Clostridia bacterium]|nr:hypothetical protein [Clostridia bacterium]